jgi:DNA-binding HxlR family transcriptional regulator
MEPSHEVSAFCPHYHRAVEVVGRRWTGAILRALLAGVGRFSELKACIPELTDRMLSERLKELEREGIVERTIIPERPVRIEYRLTAKGRALGAVIEALSVWAQEWLAPSAEGRAEQAAERSGARSSA